ncbi:MAG: YebC/PmpR family DNA-binding transcriptional regulator [Verrucomicrobia bacterium]|nr:YebC/PmpR family DNA-binding transcriptional regulator [Verrucomicrobiota bacterium]
MGAQWKQKWRELNANRKGKIVNRIVKEIHVAVKLGGEDPDLNARLAAALETARKNSVTKETITKAIKKGAGTGNDAVVYQSITFEGFAPHQVPVIVECLTDNPNRTIPEIRSVFNKGGGQFGTSGSVAWMFDHCGLVEATHDKCQADIEEVAIDCGADEVDVMDQEDLADGQIGGSFYCKTTELHNLTQALKDQGWTVSTSELTYQIKNPITISPDHLAEVQDFLGKIDDLEDTHRVYAGLA